MIKPSDLKNDLDRAEKCGDKRLLFLYSNLYNEYFVNLLYKEYIANNEYEKCTKCQKFLRPKLKQQVERLSDANIIDGTDNHDKVINLIYDIRNELSHTIEYSITNLEKRFEDIQKESLKDQTGEILNTLNKMDPWDKIKLSVFATVTTMYQEAEKLNDRNPKQTIQFRMAIASGKIWVELKDL